MLWFMWDMQRSETYWNSPLPGMDGIFSRNCVTCPTLGWQPAASTSVLDSSCFRTIGFLVPCCICGGVAVRSKSWYVHHRWMVWDMIFPRTGHLLHPSINTHVHIHIEIPYTYIARTVCCSGARRSSAATVCSSPRSVAKSEFLLMARLVVNRTNHSLACSTKVSGRHRRRPLSCMYTPSSLAGFGGVWASISWKREEIIAAWPAELAEAAWQLLASETNLPTCASATWSNHPIERENRNPGRQ